MQPSLTLWKKTVVILKLMRWFHELAAIIPFVGLYFMIHFFGNQKGINVVLPITDFVLLCIGVQLLLAIGCVINDIMDRDIDKINKPKTHLIDNYISFKNAKLLVGILTFLLLIISVYLSIYVFWEWAIIATAIYIISISYDVYFKRSPLMGNILMGLLTAAIPLTLFFYAKEIIFEINNPKLYHLIGIYCIWPFLLIVPRELSLDISDWEGDKANGCKTLPIVIGVKNARKVVYLLLIICIIYLFFIANYLPYLKECAIFSTVCISIYFWYFQKVKTRLEYIKIGRFLWFIMLQALLMFTIFSVF